MLMTRLGVIALQQRERRLLFTGVTDYCTIPSFDNLATLTVELKVYFNALTDSWLINKRDNLSDNQWQLIYYVGTLSVELFGGSTTAVASIPYTPLYANRWYSLAFTTSGVSGSTLYLYVDGIAVGSAVLSGNMKLGKREMVLGANGWSYGLNHVGKIKDVRIWNTVRSSAEILANKDALLAGDNTGLIARYGISEGKGIIVKDSIDSSNGVINGATWVEVSPDALLNKGLIGWYPLNGNALDIAGSENNGVVTGATVVDGYNGKSCYSFDGVSDDIDCGNNFNMGLGDRSFNCWIKTSSSSTSETYILSKAFFGGATGRHGIYIEDGVLGVLWANATGDGVILSSGVLVNTGLWVNISVIYDRSALVSIYINGQLVATADISSLSTVNWDTVYPFRIGAYTSSDGVSPSGFYQGLIQDFRIYNRVLLPEEIKILANV